MPRDFKSGPPRPARRAPARARRGAKGAARWSWFVAGACAGAAATAAVFLYEPGPPRGAGGVPRADRAQPGGNGTPTRFEFYTLLPEKEIAIPETDLDKPEDKPVPAASPAAGVTRYLLQVGSFRGLEDADRLKARLAFMGLEGSIQTVSIDGAETWHRVRVGPFSTKAELNEARARLRENKLDALVLKLK